MKLEFFSKTSGGKKRMDNLVIPFVEGAKRMGLTAEVRESGLPSDDCSVAVIFGYKGPWANYRGLRDDIIAAQEDNGGIVIGVDIGAFMSWQLEQNGSALLFRIALGSPTGAGEYFNKNSPADRWTKLREFLGVEVKDWRRSGDAVLFCGQADRGWQYNNPEPFKDWFKKEIAKIRCYTDRRIVFRPHPAAASLDHEWLRRHRVSVSDDRLGRNLYKAIGNEWAMATFSSSAAVDTVVSGIPTFCASEECIARDVCNQDYALLETPILFDRTQWLCDAAYTSWFVEEIREGVPLKRILEGSGV